jgi:hypothetical protein
MAAINAEMMKQLLDEFRHKEAMNAQEIGVIEQKIVELENRIAQSQDRLREIAEDREKIKLIVEKYSKAHGTKDYKTPPKSDPKISKSRKSIKPIASATAILPTVNRPTESFSSIPAFDATEQISTPPKSGPFVSPVAGNSEHATPAQGNSAKADPFLNVLKKKNQAQKLGEGEPEIRSSFSEEETSTASNEPSPSDSEPENREPENRKDDESVKSINEALRGLFR